MRSHQYGKDDGLLRRVRHLELRVKYCQHLHKTCKLSITHWKSKENPSDGLTKSLRPLSLWTNLVEAVGLVPRPTDQGSNWIRNFLNMIQQENELNTFLALPFVVSKKRSHPFAVHDFIIFLFSLFRLSY